MQSPTRGDTFVMQMGESSTLKYFLKLDEQITMNAWMCISFLAIKTFANSTTLVFITVDGTASLLDKCPCNAKEWECLFTFGEQWGEAQIKYYGWFCPCDIHVIVVHNPWTSLHSIKMFCSKRSLDSWKANWKVPCFVIQECYSLCPQFFRKLFILLSFHWSDCEFQIVSPQNQWRTLHEIIAP